MSDEDNALTRWRKQMGGDAFGDGDEAPDGAYLPWVQCQQGAVSTLKIVPAADRGQPVLYIPFLQPMTLELHPNAGQLALLCHSTGMTVFLEGNQLDTLADLIAERRVKEIHEWDVEKYAEKGNRGYIEKLTIENKK